MVPAHAEGADRLRRRRPAFRAARQPDAASGAADHGIVFRRTDLGVGHPRAVRPRRRYAAVHGARRVVRARIGTVEHVMAALAGCGIDNALVEVDGPEPPILDGSAAPFVFLLDCAGIVEQDAPRQMIEIRRPVRVSDGRRIRRTAPERPAPGLDMALSIDFAAAAIGRQALSLRLTPDELPPRAGPRPHLCAARGDRPSARRRPGAGRQPGQCGRGRSGAGAEPRRPAHAGRVRPPQAAGRGRRPGAGRRAAVRALRRASVRPRAEQPAAAGAVRRRVPAWRETVARCRSRSPPS